MSHEPQPRFSVMPPPSRYQELHTDHEATARNYHSYVKAQGVNAVLVDHHEFEEDIADMAEERVAMEDTYNW